MENALPLRTDDDLDPILDAAREKRVVLIGEASHGSSEFYAWRARITRRLIEEHGFSFVAVEGDWPACWELDRYVKSVRHESASAAVEAFRRWPTWMWANWEVVAFSEWLKRYNSSSTSNNVGFYGLDVYSLSESLEAVIDYLREHRPDALEQAQEAFECFDPSRGDDGYARRLSLVPGDCADEAASLLARALESHLVDGERAFDAVRNAAVVAGAEKYYRVMLRGGGDSWNVRDIHMMETLESLLAFHGDDARAIVWAHNTHVGDARATDMSDAGLINIGQLARERFGDGALLVGFSSFRGSVIAGRRWGSPMRRLSVPDADSGSWESLIHSAVGGDCVVLVGDDDAFSDTRGHRAIGVVYNPESESMGNYVPTVLSERYDILLHIDESSSLHPLALLPSPGVPETYPFGL